MGKTQSKRSVDITTEAKKSPEEEVTGKLEKIEDLDQKVNGDASSQENAETEKKEGDETENDKDLTTEKSGGESGAQDGGGDTNTGQSNASAVEVSKEDDSSASKDGNKPTEEISPLSEQQKPKKEKVKKKWSFRSISFGKKDKQKPAKTEDGAADNAAATNGDAAPQTTEAAAAEEKSDKNEKDEAAGDSEAKKSSEKPTENGDTSEKELNGEKTSTPTTPIEEQPAKEIASNENTTNITNNTTETASSAIPENNTTTATENRQTEKQTITATNSAAESTAANVSNGDAIERNGTETLSITDEQKNQVIDKDVNLMGETSDFSEKIKSIPKVINEVSDNNGIHQNGTSANGEELETENESKSEVEVIFQTEQAAHTDDLVTLTTSATTSSSPKTTPILLLPDPTNIDSMKIENSSNSVITDSNDTHKSEEATIAVETAENIVLDVAPKAIEPVSTIEIVNVDTGNEEPSEPEIHKDEKNAVQSVVENQLEGDENENSSTEINEVTTTTNDESPKPPPLPVSPPPSQVSVFAFNDNNRTEEEEGICSTTHTDIVADSETSQSQRASVNLQNDVQIMSDLQPSIDENLLSKTEVSEIPSSTVDIVTADVAQSVQNGFNPENKSTDIVENNENSEVPDVEENHSNKETTENPSSVSYFSNTTDGSTENEFVKVATAVVDEISEKAVELIQQQNHIQLQQSEMEEIDNNIITSNDNLKTDNTSTDMETKNHIDNISTHATHDSTEEEVINEMESLKINCEDTNNIIKKDEPLDVESHMIDCIKMTDKHIVDGENEITTEICSQTVVAVNENQN